MALLPGFRRFRTSQIFAVLVAVFALLFGSIVVLLAYDQREVVVATERLQQQTVPEIIRYQRLARNLEQLRQEGERFFAVGTPEARQQALFVLTLVASHPSMVEHADAAALAREAERFLAEANRLARENPASLKKSYEEWNSLSRRLSLQVDDVSIQGVNLALVDLDGMAHSMQTARVKLAGALLLVGAFLLLLAFLLRKLLIVPLQRIDHELSELNVARPAPEYPDTPLSEVFSIEEASRRLHDSLLEVENARAELEKLAHVDGLTGLFNRRYFMELAAAELLRAHRYERPVTVGMADLDFFKRINDSYGHAAGDLVLKSFARLLRETLRQTDLVCRYGGEEFAFVFPESSIDEARVLAERVRKRFADLSVELPDGTMLRGTVSIGLTSGGRVSLEKALHYADEALYQAKDGGRNRIVVIAAE